MAEPSFSVQPLLEGDIEAAMDLLIRTFYVDEPMNEAVNLYTGPGSCPEVDEYCTHAIPEGLSFKAVDTEGNIVGVTISGICPLKEDYGNAILSQAQSCTNPKFQRILYVLARRESGARLWEKFPEDKQLVEVKVAATDPSWRRRGIMNALVHETEKAAKKRGITLMRCDTSSAYSAKSAERLGFTCVYEALYSEMKMNGEPLLLPQAPHLHDKVYIKRI